MKTAKPKPIHDDDILADLAEPAESMHQLVEQVALLALDAAQTPGSSKLRAAACRVAGRWALNQVRMALLSCVEVFTVQSGPREGQTVRVVDFKEIDRLLGVPAQGVPRADSFSR